MSNNKKVIFLIISLVIFAAGYYIYDSFVENSRWKRDNVRMSDVSRIVESIEIYYFKNNRYPESLSSLTPDLIAQPLIDPSTNEVYRYRIIKETGQYEVCTNEFESKKAKRLGLEECAMSIQK